MSSRGWPTATRKDHERFCSVEGWRRTTDATGRTGTHHVTYEIDLPDARTLRTRISHPVDPSDYGPSLWRHVLRDQLMVSEEEFWACARDGRPPPRSVPAPDLPSLPAELVHLLVHTVGLTDEEVGAMTKDEAVARLGHFWTTGSPGPRPVSDLDGS